ncbi:MAG: cob(I)yrinic acid a,c-diamide adenosyltransferase [Paludibacteraceae bacterium]|nr:cob(I)yrinic acid a,c-diamide adenosyltransferase [Paludibacteraceae bacterium]
MKIYTKTGDTGQTSLASGQRVSKSDDRIEAYGTADELNSFVGLLRSRMENMPSEDAQLEWIQNKLFNIGAYLACAEGEWIIPEDVAQLEQWIDAMQADLPPMKGFVLPAGNETVSLCHICRTVTRRLERRMMVIEDEKFDKSKNNEIFKFVNRLSDFWFVFAQKCGKNAGISLFLWKK